MPTHSRKRLAPSLLTMGMLPLLATGCFAGGGGGSLRGACDALEPSVREAAVATAIDAGDRSVLAVDALIERLDRACGRG